MAYKQSIKKLKEKKSNWKLNETYSPYYQKTKLFVTELDKRPTNKEIKKTFETTDKVAIARGYSKEELKNHLIKNNWKSEDIIFN